MLLGHSKNSWCHWHNSEGVNSNMQNTHNVLRKHYTPDKYTVCMLILSVLYLVVVKAFCAG